MSSSLRQMQRGKRTEDDDTRRSVADLLVLGPRELDHALRCRVGDFNLAQDRVAVVRKPEWGARQPSEARTLSPRPPRDLESNAQDASHGCIERTHRGRGQQGGSFHSDLSPSDAQTPLADAVPRRNSWNSTHGQGSS